ncbi:ribonuclease HII [Mycoplasmopsis edwardii]|uniref:Ribonuclease HII n=1 Tax=Mycoplasmopsis edwardii TaxID=53558 RepID=A0ACD4PH64_9BACT|nr:ribonuclease HII [Mycoplasmopsis edwardii]WBP83999.1 ribonuclease HII [Mycoplasmopsis edwardii]
MLNYEKENFKGKLIAGCDEAGRGPVCGPLVAACVILPIDYINDKINDSKKLSEKQREILFDEIKNVALDYYIEIRSVEDINNSNPKAESRIGMAKAIKQLKIKPEHVLTDFEKIEIDIPQTNLVKGDEISLNIAAASILAKVTRDKILDEYDKKYPEYGFKSHKGYLTKKHLEALKKYGVIEGFYRVKYKPIINIINNEKNN